MVVRQWTGGKHSGHTAHTPQGTCDSSQFPLLGTFISVSTVKILSCYHQGQGNRQDSYNQNRIVYTVSSDLQIFWQPNVILLYIIISQSFL